MKLTSILAFVVLLTSYVFAQTDTIPLVTLQEINQVPDTNAWVNSPLTGQLVRVQGQVSVRPLVSDVGNRNPVLYFGKHWGCYIQTPADQPWGGLNIYSGDTTTPGTQLTTIDLADTGKTYEFTGVVTMYGQTVEFVLKDSIEIQLISDETKRYDPIPLTIDSLYNPDGSFNYGLRKYLGMQVIFTADDQHPLIVSDVITSTGSTGGGFKLNDLNGHFVTMYAQSRYFKTGSTYRERPDYTPPPAGSYVSYVKGILEAYLSGSGMIWEIVPCYPEDLGPVLQSPPTISSVRRDKAVVGPTDDVLVTCTVTGNLGAYVTNVALFKRTDFGTTDSLQMTRGTGADSIKYSVTIPAVNSDSAFVDFYIKAYDNNAMSVSSPQNINTSRYSYFVLNRPLTIQDIRYSPFGSAYSSYHNYRVEVTGIVTADTSDIPGNHGTNPPRVYIQNGSGKWSGIVLGTYGLQVTDIKRGDLVSVAGTVGLGSFGARIDSLTNINVISSNNPLPEAVYVPIDSIGRSSLGNLTAEPWNGSLIKYQNINIDSANADGIYNYGESFGKETGGNLITRIIWSDGNTSFNVGAGSVKVIKGDFFQEITGILSYTHSQYKLTPRKNDDILGYTPVGVNDKTELPQQFSLSQNYPNPFNPSTVIRYSVPKSGVVTLRIYNVLGQEVKTLVNTIQNPGTYNVSFNASSLSSGIYFYSLNAGDFVQVKKMMLVK